MFEDRSIYIHVPFCKKKCSYCDFYSVTDASLIDDFIISIDREIVQKGLPKMRVPTIYLGGGTPSVLSVDQICGILSSLQNNFNIDSMAEVTIEVNPGTIDASYLKSLKACGINRISIGVQSFDKKKLQFLDRIHTEKQAQLIIEAAQKAGFENIGIDLIYGLPGESISTWEKELDMAVTFSLAHLSCYMLTIEPGTPLHGMARKRKFRPMDSAGKSEFFRQTSRVLSAHGYDHYEISNFAKNNRLYSKHNLRYWNREPYIGFGPAAHSFDGIKRAWNAADFKPYADCVQNELNCGHNYEILTENQAMLEVILLGLRTKNGVDTTGFEQQFHCAFNEKFMPVIEHVEKQELGKTENNRFSLNLDGWTRLDSITEAFADLIV